MILKNTKFLLVIINLIFLILSGVTLAQPPSLGLSVSPQVFELDVFPGEKITQKINLRNLSKVAVPIAVRVTDFTAEEDSGEMLFDEALQDPSIASRKWFEIKNPNFILDPEGKKEVEFTITVPENAEPGGHYSVILFEPQLPSFYFLEGEPRAIPVVGVLFLLSVKTFSLEPEIQQKLEIVEFSLPKKERLLVLENLLSKLTATVRGPSSIKVQAATEVTITEKSPSKFILRIKNNDIYHQKVKGKLLVYNTFGKKIGESEIKKTTILPGKIRKFPIELSPEIPEKLKWLPALISNFLVQNTSLGKYKGVIILEAPNQKLEIETQFWVFPWKIILILFFLIFFLILIRRRIVTALKILLVGKP